LKIIGIIARWIFILALPALFISFSLAWGFNSLWLYDWGFQKYGVSQSTGLSEAELDKAARALINYFNSTDEYIHVTVTGKGQSFELFNPAEQIHFKDVKALIWLDYRVALVAFLIVLVYAITAIFWKKGRFRRYLARGWLWGSGISIALIIILGLASFLDFDQLFLQFHYLAFTNSYWSAEGYMLLLFPGGFWNDAALICISFMAGMALITGFVAVLYLKLAQNSTIDIRK
jgi:integral membrane protein (TIGR01906 family)